MLQDCSCKHIVNSKQNYQRRFQDVYTLHLLKYRVITDGMHATFFERKVGPWPQFIEKIKNERYNLERGGGGDRMKLQ